MKTCIICGKPFDARGRAKCCSPECSKINEKNNNNKRNKRYQQSDKGKAAQKRYWESDKGKATQKRYSESDKGKATQKRYSESDKGKATQKRYKQSDKGKDANKKYQQSDKGKAVQKKYKKNKIAELCEQYDGDLDLILKDCCHSWEEREAIMLVKYGVSYSEGMYQKIKDCPVCEVTGEKTNDLVIHHLYSFNTHPELGNDPANMVRITTDVHKAFHKEYGYGDNTPEQWMEFVENY